MKNRPLGFAAALILLGLVTGLWGIRWGLPGRERLARVMPPGLDGPAFHQTLADSWSSMHRRLGENLMANPKSFDTFSGVIDVPAGWKTPPPELLNSYRSFYVRSEKEDEQSILLALSRMKPRQLNFRTHLFTYGSLYIYSVGAALAAGAVTGTVALKSSILFYLNDPEKMAGMYLAGRLVSVAAFIAGGLMLLRLGRLYVGLEAGALGAALYLMLPASVVQAHLLKNHTFWTFFALWTMERCVRVLKDGRLKDYAAAGAVSGLAMASFLSAWAACFAVAVACALRLLGLHAPAAKPCRPGPELRGLAVAGACAIAVFLILCPYWILDYGEALQEMKVLSGFGGFNPLQPLLFVTVALRRGATDPVAVLVLGGAALALLRGKREPVLLLFGLVFFAALAGMVSVRTEMATNVTRYFLGWLALGCLLAGRLIQELRALKGPAGRFVTAAAAVVLLGTLCQGLAYAHGFAVSEGARSNHYLSGEWIEKNIPAGSVIGLLRMPQPSNSPFFRWDRYHLRFIDETLAPRLAPAASPAYLALTIPDYDDRIALGRLLDRYELLASFPRDRLFPWIAIDATSTTANPLIEIYRLRKPA